MLLAFIASIFESLEAASQGDRERKQLKRYQIGLLLAVCYECNIGSMATTVGNRSEYDTTHIEFRGVRWTRACPEL